MLQRFTRKERYVGEGIPLPIFPVTVLRISQTVFLIRRSSEGLRPPWSKFEMRELFLCAL